MGHVDLFRVPAVAISKNERAFFKRLGARVAELRKALDITQVQVAEHLGVSQQTANAYETGYRRIPVSAIPRGRPGLSNRVFENFRLPSGFTGWSVAAIPRCTTTWS